MTARLAMVLALTLTRPEQETAEYWQPSPERLLTGRAAYYRAGLMAEVATNRGLDLAGYRGGVALMRAGDLGRDVWILFPDGWDGPFLSVDCARRAHYEMNLARDRVVDIDRDIWLEHELPGWPVRVLVSFAAPVMAVGIRPR